MAKRQRARISVLLAICILYAVLMNIHITFKSNITQNMDTRKTYQQISYSFKLDGEAFDDKNNIPNIKVREISCAKLFKNDKQELQNAERLQNEQPKVPIPELHFTKSALHNCQKFKDQYQFTQYPLSEEEETFPLAYSLVVYKDIEQVVRLLRAIYQPQNYYCVHADKKANSLFRKALALVASCFDNIYMSSKSTKVYWGEYSVLEAELICIQDMWKYKSWRYFINLTGQEFPLQTNGDLVKILKTVNGANLGGGTIKKFQERFEKAKTVPPPANVTLVKGDVHVILQRGFVDYIVENETALEFREWVKDMVIPDEGFFSSLMHSPQLQVPGAYTGVPETDPEKYPLLPRYKNWYNREGQCQGKNVRGVCVLGVGDLYRVFNRKELFVNKLHLTFHPFAYDCLEELHFNKTREGVLGLRAINVSYYANLDVTKNHIN